MLTKGPEYSQYNLLVKGGNVLQPTQSNDKQMYQIVSKELQTNDWWWLRWYLWLPNYSRFHTKILEDDW